MKIFIENPRLYHYPLIRYWLWKKADIYVFDFKQSIRSKKWLKDLVYSKKVFNISHYVKGNDHLALDNIEKVYCFVAKESPLIGAITRLYEDDNVVLAFKKSLVKRLSEFYAMQITLNEKLKKALDGEKIVFISCKYPEALRMLMKSGGFVYELKNIFIPFWVESLNVVGEFFSRIIHGLASFLFGIFSLGIIAWKMLVKESRNNIPEYRYALPITNPKFQFKFEGHRAVDFLLDGMRIAKSNAVFLWMNSYDRKMFARLCEEGFQVWNLTKKDILFSRKLNFGKKGRSVLKRTFLFVWRSAFASFREYDFNVSSARILLWAYLVWNIILNSVRLKNYITFNDEGINHIGRNILLNQHGCETWYYAHSGSLGFVLSDDDENLLESRHWLWSFLYYDSYIGWSRKMIDYQKLHHQQIKHYYNVGCLWSEPGGGNKIGHNWEAYFYEQEIKNIEVSKDMKIVSFFDTSFFDGVASEFPVKDGIKFYNDILRLLNEMPNLFIIIKEKKSVSTYMDRKSFVYSDDGKELVGLVDKLNSFPNCYVAGFKTDPVDLIKISDLVVTYVFSSSTIEALGSRKKAIFYDPIGRFQRNCYKEIPDFIAYGYDELKVLLNKLLYKVSEEEYEKYLDKEIQPVVENCLDGRALIRFRNLLCGEDKSVCEV